MKAMRRRDQRRTQGRLGLWYPQPEHVAMMED